jgi:hypothetical protein
MSLIALLMIAAVPALATPAASPPVKEKLVCKTVGETGSRLGGKRECKTKAEWDRIAEENQSKARSDSGR